MNEQILSQRPLFGCKLNNSHPLAKGLVGAWLMNDVGQRVWDSSPYSNHGSLVGFDSPPKRGGYGIKFDGVNDLVRVPYNKRLLSNVTEFSVSVTIKPSINQSNYRAITIIDAGGAGGDRAMGFLFLSNNTLYGIVFKAGSTTTYTDLFTTTTINGKSEILATLTFDSLNLRIYINDLLVGISTNSSFTTINNITQPLCIGNRGDFAMPFNTSMDAVYFWSQRALSATEVKQLYLNPYDMFMPSQPAQGGLYAASQPPIYSGSGVQNIGNIV